jgi:hypothetical protein
MRLTFVQLSVFTAKWAKLGLADEDLRSLENALLENPEVGTVIPGTGGLRKLRFAPPSAHAGKRGGLRVIYAFIPAGATVYFFTLYGKNQQSDMTPDEKSVFRKVLARLHQRYAARNN